MARIVLAVCLAWLGWLSMAAAHEVRPTVGDLRTEGDTLTLVLRFGSIEPVLAGVSLAGVQNTNDTEASAEIDALRALRPDEIAARVRARAGQILAPVVLATPEVVPLQLLRVEVDDVLNTELPRETRLFVQAALPPGTQAITLSWPVDYGALILRQMDVTEGFTGFLSGGTTPPILLPGGGTGAVWHALAAQTPAGFAHILPGGLDHVLLVLALVLLSPRPRAMLWPLAAIVLGHAASLAVGGLGIVAVPMSLVNLLLALVIVYVAVENLLTERMPLWRPVVLFALALLHGTAYAAELGAPGLNAGQVVLSLLGFNIGLELGQFLVAGLLLLVVAVGLGEGPARPETRGAQLLFGVLALICVATGALVWRDAVFVMATGVAAPVVLWPLAGLCVGLLFMVRADDREAAYRRFVTLPASVGIALVGAWWAFERLAL